MKLNVKMQFARFAKILLFLFIGLSIFLSCRKDKSSEPVKENPQLIERFFNLGSSNDKDIEEFAKEMSIQNEDKHFLKYFIENNGYPLWEKTQKLKTSTGTLAIIPFVLDKQKEINGFVIAKKIINNKYLFFLFHKNSNGNYSSKGNLINLNVAQIQTIINHFNYFQFGIKTYKLLDNKQLPLQIRQQYPNRINKDSLVGKIKISNLNNANKSDVNPVSLSSCVTYQEETQWFWNPDGDAANNNGDEFYLYSTYSAVTVCAEFGDPVYPDTQIAWWTNGQQNGGGSSPYVTSWTNDGRPIIDEFVVEQYFNFNEPFWNNVRTFDEQLGTNFSVQTFSSTNLRNLCIQRGWQNGVTSLEFNRKVGKAFEETALKFYDLPENRYNYPAPRRKANNFPNPPTLVRPDAFDNFMIQWIDQFDGRHFDQLPNTFAAEVKAYNGVLQLQSNNWQILGELEVLRKNFDDAINSPYLIPATPRLTINNVKTAPVLFFITTEDTEIGQSIIDEAFNLQISIWQVKAIYDATNNKISFGTIKMIHDKSGRISKGSEVPQDFFKAALRGAMGVQVPMSLLTPIQPNFDLDPEELQN